MNALETGGMIMSRVRVNHPGETYGYRLQVGDAVVVFIPDNELDPPYDPIVTFSDLAAFCHGADILIHDSQFVEEDFPRKRGWGHSFFLRACELAHAAAAKHLVLFHHDPDRSDDQLDVIQERARTWLADHGSQMTCTVAFEGLELPLSISQLPGKASVA
jgi:ribonuclease BN (tRNA processing enzyme)